MTTVGRLQKTGSCPAPCENEVTESKLPLAMPATFPTLQRTSNARSRGRKNRL